MRKLSDEEFVERTRANNRRRAERQRQRKMDGGRSALTVWVPGSLRSALMAAANASGKTMSDIATEWMTAALSGQVRSVEPAAVYCATADLFATPEPNSTDTKGDAPADLPSVSVGAERDTLMAEVGALLAEGLSGNAIARRLNSEGFRSQQGTELRGANLLREYRAWKEKSDGSDSTVV